MPSELNQKAVSLSQDLLSDTARASRKGLLVTSSIGLLVALGGVKPSALKIFDVTLPELTASKCLAVLAGIIFLQVIGFSIYVVSDWINYRHLMDKFRRAKAGEELDAMVPPGHEEYDAISWETDYKDDHVPWRYGPRIAKLRAFWDFLLPVIAGCVVIIVMIWKAVTSE